MFTDPVDFAGADTRLDSLSLLRLPELNGKRLLHVHCRSGLLCGFAQHAGASKVLGVHPDADIIATAQRDFPHCEFQQLAWDQLPSDAFDVVVFSSALHLAERQSPLIRQLVDALTPDGVLVLELGVATGRRKWKRIAMGEQSFKFPSQNGLAALLKPYAWKLQGTGLIQPSDPVRRFVVHIQKLRPYAYLLLQPPGYGKSTLARRLFASAKVPVLSGDLLYSKVARGRMKAPAELTELISSRYQHYEFNGQTKKQFDWAEVTQRILEAGCLPQLLDFWLQQHGDSDVAIDSYLPQSHHAAVRSYLEQRGFIAVLLDWQMQRTALPLEQTSTQVQQFASSLQLSSQQSVVIRRLKNSRWRWCLDQPAVEQPCSLDTELAVVGWVLPDQQGHVPEQYYLACGQQRQCLPFNRTRADVQAAYPQSHWQPNALPGFRSAVPASWLAQGVEFGVVADGRFQALARLETKDAPAKPWHRLWQRFKA